MRGMNLEKLFETQKVLRERINYQGEDRFNKLVLALLVELGECANEWRGFKFWSKDQEPRTKVQLFPNSDGTAPDWNNKNPLLEEYVDGLHFVLELGLELKVNPVTLTVLIKFNKKVGTIEEQFGYLYYTISKLMDPGCDIDLVKYYHIIQAFIGLGNHLDFTWEQVEQAYYDKNKINHVRQDEGY
jgi:dimeric dUTPase (all-alpha-NTP-PPase superfamily)